MLLFTAAAWTFACLAGTARWKAAFLSHLILLHASSCKLACPYTVPTLPKYCPNTAPILFQHCPNTVPTLPRYCSNIASALFQRTAYIAVLRVGGEFYCHSVLMGGGRGGGESFPQRNQATHPDPQGYVLHLTFTLAIRLLNHTVWLTTLHGSAILTRSFSDLPPTSPPCSKPLDVLCLFCCTCVEIRF